MLAHLGFIGIGRMGGPMAGRLIVRQLWQFADAANGPASDFTNIIRCIEDWAGVEVKRRN